MGKAGKLRRKIERLRTKRAKKAANRARWEELKRLGQNTKSKRSLVVNKRNRKAKRIGHSPGRCGNIGCRKCDPCNIYGK